jgi:lipopolysaccharide export system permease protein
MHTIDRYVLRRYFRILVLCFLSLTGLYIVIDAFGNLEELLRIAQAEGSAVRLFAQYYGGRALVFFDRTSPLLALVSATFVATHLQRSNELAALLAAGIPKARIVAPLLLGSVFVSLLAGVNRELGIPPCRKNLVRNAQDWDGAMERSLHPRYDNRTDILIDGSSAVAAERKIRQPIIRRQPALGNFGTQLSAETAWYRDAEGDRPAGYLLDGVTQPAKLPEIPNFSLDGRPLVLGPRDTPWLEADQCFVVSELNFEQLAAGSAWRQYSSTRELIAGLHNPSLDFTADVRVAVHARFVQPLLDLTLLCLGLPVVLSRQSRNVFVAAGICVLVVAGFLLVVLACQQAGAASLIAPSLAAWLPLLLFVPVAANAARALWD